MQETDRMIKDVTRSVGRLGNRQGDFVEDLVELSVMRLFQGRGIVVHEVHSKIQSTRGTESIKIDLLVVHAPHFQARVWQDTEEVCRE